jgi:acyl-CoA synthetase (AMP-forming)/AMP-acid ligase II
MDDLSFIPQSALLGRLLMHASARPEAPAYRQYPNDVLTYRQLSDRVSSLAHVLRQNLPPASVVLLCSPSMLAFPIAFLGILAAGCTAFPVSAESADPELLRAAADSSAKAVIGDARAIGLLKPSIAFTVSIDALPDAIHQVTFASGDLLLASSGTTGLPKIARRTAFSIDAVAQAMAEMIDFRAGDRVLMTVPLSHSYGLEHGLLAPIWAGSCVHLCRGLNLQIIWPELESGVTIFPGVPSTFEMLATFPGNPPPAPQLRLAYAAGGPLPRSVFDAFAARFGVRVTQLYGATEIGSVTYNSPDEPFDSASVGRPMKGVDIRILPVAEDLSSSSPTNQGHIAIRAASMFREYLNEPAPLIDGFFPTGDLGYIDSDGRLFVTGRIKLLIDIGGMKVNPLEVESVLKQHPDVRDCIVVAMKQSDTVNRLKAIILTKDAQRTPSFDQLRRLAREQLAPYKIPRHFELRDQFPRSATGKILRHLLETQ